MGTDYRNLHKIHYLGGSPSSRASQKAVTVGDDVQYPELSSGTYRIIADGRTSTPSRPQLESQGLRVWGLYVRRRHRGDLDTHMDVPLPGQPEQRRVGSLEVLASVSVCAFSGSFSPFQSWMCRRPVADVIHRLVGFYLERAHLQDVIRRDHPAPREGDIRYRAPTPLLRS
jgi:hypothetical protein